MKQLYYADRSTGKKRTKYFNVKFPLPNKIDLTDYNFATEETVNAYFIMAKYFDHPDHKAPQPCKELNRSYVYNVSFYDHFLKVAEKIAYEPMTRLVIYQLICNVSVVEAIRMDFFTDHVDDIIELCPPILWQEIWSALHKNYVVHDINKYIPIHNIAKSLRGNALQKKQFISPESLMIIHHQCNGVILKNMVQLLNDFKYCAIQFRCSVAHLYATDENGYGLSQEIILARQEETSYYLTLFRKDSLHQRLSNVDWTDPEWFYNPAKVIDWFYYEFWDAYASSIGYNLITKDMATLKIELKLIFKTLPQDKYFFSVLEWLIITLSVNLPTFECDKYIFSCFPDLIFSQFGFYMSINLLLPQNKMKTLEYIIRKLPPFKLRYKEANIIIEHFDQFSEATQLKLTSDFFDDYLNDKLRLKHNTDICIDISTRFEMNNDYFGSVFHNIIHENAWDEIDFLMTNRLIFMKDLNKIIYEPRLLIETIFEKMVFAKKVSLDFDIDVMSIGKRWLDSYIINDFQYQSLVIKFELFQFMKFLPYANHQGNTPFVHNKHNKIWTIMTNIMKQFPEGLDFINNLIEQAGSDHQKHIMKQIMNTHREMTTVSLVA